MSKDGPAAKLPKSRWLDDEADEAADARHDNINESGMDQAEEALPEPGDNIAVPSEDPTGHVSDTATLAQESASPLHPRKRNMLLESRGKDNFEFLREIGSGTYGLVSKFGPLLPAFALELISIASVSRCS